MSRASPRSTPPPSRDRIGSAQGFALLQPVYVQRDRPDLGVRVGECGTIVEVFDQPDRAYYVEFVSEDGTTRAEGAFTPDELTPSPPRH